MNKNKMKHLLPVLLFPVFILVLILFMPSDNLVQMDYSDFIREMEGGNVEFMEISSPNVYFDLNNNETTNEITHYAVMTETSDSLIKRALENGISDILIVAHSGISKAFRAYFEGIPEDGQFLHLGLKNCEVKKYVLEVY